MKLCSVVWAGSLTLAILVASSQHVNAAAYYGGKTITIIVGYGPGGGYDRVARLLAKHLPKHIPGKPTVLVENMPGADSMIATNHLYNIAKPDGLTIGTFNRGMSFAQLLKAQGVRFDIMKFAWIGSAAVESATFAIRSEMPYKTFAEAQQAKSPLMVGSTGPADSNGQFSLLLKEYLGVPMKMINYPSGADVQLAIERKELDGMSRSYSSLKLLIDRGVVRPLIRCGVALPENEKLPVDESVAPNNTAKTVMSMRSAPDGVGRPYVAPPKTPPETMKILRDAFIKVEKDPELVQDAAKMMEDIKYVPPEEVLKVLNGLLSQPPEMVKEFSKFIKF
jgi:tripartite-type tricarboxylate transporter receptor subunit TctC